MSREYIYKDFEHEDIAQTKPQFQPFLNLNYAQHRPYQSIELWSTNWLYQTQAHHQDSI